jgi:DNA (cytosine-5)-methyltransferase 1
MSKNNEHKIPILSFFSGGGFMDMGFEQAGFSIVWSNEYDSDFVKFNKQGIGHWRKSRNLSIQQIINNQSISEISCTKILDEAFGGEEIDFFGIIGGPPCQDFSMNGKQKGFGGERGKLTIEFIDKILTLRPSFFVIENVPGLIMNKNNKLFYLELLEQLKVEYHIDMRILNSLDFGVPQSRKRLFTLGFKKKVPAIENFQFCWPLNRKYNGVLHSKKWPKQDVFGLNPVLTDDIPLELCVISCLVDEKDSSEIPNANEYFELKTSLEKLNGINEGETCRPSFKRLHRYRYSPTTCYGNNEVHLHPFKNRRISVREALRIQGVPDSYVLEPTKSLSKKFKMIGNGVPVPLAMELGKAILDFIKKEYK